MHLVNIRVPLYFQTEVICSPQFYVHDMLQFQKFCYSGTGIRFSQIFNTDLRETIHKTTTVVDDSCRFLTHTIKVRGPILRFTCPC